ncbi:MAG TPA: putative motility protein [Tepidisphaeraceae bacterium]|nr:putative motility protein [Tepidisphaeraceae bacterium]
MSLVNAAVGMKQAQTASKVQYAVARKMLDNQQMQGAAIVKLINAANTSQVKAGDAMIAAATGLGGQLDTYA